MALVCFPFKTEDVRTVLRNVDVAVSHGGVDVVLLVAAATNDCYKQVRAAVAARNASPAPYAKPVRVLVQARLGSALRAGKGDGMNTAMQYFLGAHHVRQNALREPLKRLHFYDADIESFDGSWISKAEDGAALGYDVVRHYFPRSSTDAQVTWQITKVGFALLWPRSSLPWVQQPLGGELCLTRRVVEVLMSDARVLRQSDWGIDTLYTFVCAQRRFSLLETYVPQGKRHALYGALHQLKPMVCECFAAVQSLRHERVGDGAAVHRVEPPSCVPLAITESVGFDIERSVRLLRGAWSARQRQLLALFEPRVRLGLLGAAEWPQFSFMHEAAWVRAYKQLLQHFCVDDAEWRDVLFRMWVARVLDYTTRHVVRGYHAAMRANVDMVSRLHMRRTMEQLRTCTAAEHIGERLEACHLRGHDDERDDERLAVCDSPTSSCDAATAAAVAAAMASASASAAAVAVGDHAHPLSPVTSQSRSDA